MEPTPKPGALPPEVRAQVQELLQANRFVEAIKRVREATQWSLRDAKDAVDAFREGREPEAPRPPPAPALDSATRAAAEALLAQGLLDDAAVVVHDRTGWDMKVVKGVLDELRGVVPAAEPDPVAELEAMGARLAAIRAEVEALLAQKKVVEALKLVRARTGMGLAESKAYLDGLRGE